MMAALQQYQDADGMWHQLIDGPDSTSETCTAMFTYAMIPGEARLVAGKAVCRGAHWFALTGLY